jgi:hypothetical protein
MNEELTLYKTHNEKLQKHLEQIMEENDSTIQKNNSLKEDVANIQKKAEEKVIIFNLRLHFSSCLIFIIIL